jgi:hypothetical protein
LQPESSAVKFRVKVILETSVLIASSTFFISKELKSSKIIKDEHFHRAMELVSELGKRVKQRIGVYTRTIARETRDALRDAVKRHIERAGADPQNLKIILDHCGDLLERTLEILSLEPVDQERRSHFLSEAYKMYSDLLDRAAVVTEQSTRSLAEQKTAVTASPKFYGIQSEIQTKQLRQQYRQLYFLRDNPARPKDKEILAEAAALYESYAAEAPTELYMASTDCSHFSPAISYTGIVSDQITKQIEESFHVKCDCPESVGHILRRLK